MEDYMWNLENIQIANKEKRKEYPLLCDFQAAKTPSIQRFLPYFFVLFGVLASLLHPGMSESITKSVKIDKINGTNTFNTSFSGLNSEDQFLDVNILFNEDKWINGTAKAIIMNKGKIISTVNHTFNKKFSKYSNFLRSNMVSFDSVQLLFSSNLTSGVEMIEFVKSDIIFERIIITFKFIFSIVAIIYTVIFSRELNDEQIQTFEQGLTVGLCYILIGFTDILCLVDIFFPSFIGVLRKLLLRDIFLCYYMFYVTAIFVYFKREETDNQALSISMPMAIMMCGLTFLFSMTACINIKCFAEFDSMFHGNQEAFNIYEIIFFFAFACIYFYQLHVGEKNVKATSQERFNNYKSLTLPFILITGITFSIEIFMPDNSLSALVPFCSLFGSSIGLIYTHLSVHEELTVYHKASGDDNEIQGSTLLEDTENIDKSQDKQEPDEFSDLSDAENLEQLTDSQNDSN